MFYSFCSELACTGIALHFKYVAYYQCKKKKMLIGISELTDNAAGMWLSSGKLCHPTFCRHV